LTDRTRRFEAIVLPHLNAAYNLARWLLRDDSSAQDVVQEACLRAFRFFDGFRGDDARPWLLGIVRNSCYTWLREQKRPGEHVEFDDERDSGAIDPALSRAMDNPEALLLRKLDQAQVNKAIENLPPAFREVLVLRELEELTYEEIAQVSAIPIGTVMSRLARARALLRAALTPTGEKDEQWKITKIRN
jgi:RNA polymerase sigma factor (sigma-70 family)